ncbi:tetratricopeptide repeat protein [Glycomyces halotolerans]
MSVALSIVAWIIRKKIQEEDRTSDTETLTHEIVQESFRLSSRTSAYEDALVRLPVYVQKISAHYDSEIMEYGWVLTSFGDATVSPQNLASEWAIAMPARKSELTPAGKLILAELLVVYGQVQKGIEILIESIADGLPGQTYWMTRVAMLAGEEFGVEDETSKTARDEVRKLNPSYPLLIAYENLIGERWQDAINAVIDWHNPSVWESDAIANIHHNALAGMEKYDEAIDVLESRGSAEESSGILILSAELRLFRAAIGQSDSHWQDVFTASRHALRARNIRRSWRGDSVEAVVVAMEASIAAKDPDTAWRLSQPAPEGEATIVEAVDDRVIALAGTAAAMTGRLQEAARIKDQASSEITRKRLDAEIIRASQGANYEERALQAWRDYFDCATSVADRIYAMRAMAFLGVTIPSVLDELRSKYPYAIKDVEDVHRIMSLTEPNLDRKLRKYQNVHIIAAVRRAEVAAESDRSRGVEIYKEAYGFWKDPQLLLEAVDLLVKEEQWVEACKLIDTALAENGTLWPGRQTFHQRSVVVGFLAEDWARVEKSCKVLLEDDPKDSESRWTIARVQLYRGQPELAWGTLSRGDSMDPKDVSERAHLVLELGRRYASSLEIAQIALGIIDSFVNDEAVFAHALLAVTMKQDETALPEEIGMKLTRAWSDFFVRYPNSDIVSRVSIVEEEGLPEQLTDSLRARYEILQKVVQEITEKEFPWGLLQKFTGDPYSTLLLNNDQRYFLLGSYEMPDVESDRSAVDQLAQKSCLIDISAIHTLAVIHEISNDLIAEVESVSIIESALRDLQAGRDLLQAPSDGYLVHEPVSGEPMYVETDPDSKVQKLQRCSTMIEIANQLSRLPYEQIRHFQGEIYDARHPWFITMDAAIDQDCIVWCDDLGLRRELRRRGVASFSSVTLMDFARDANRIDAERVFSAKESLIKQRFVDVLVEHDRLIKIAQEAIWRPGVIALMLSRSAIWKSSENAVEIFRTAFFRSTVQDLSIWAAAAVEGIKTTFVVPGQVKWLAGIAEMVFVEQEAKPYHCKAVIEEIVTAVPDLADSVVEATFKFVWSKLTENYALPDAAMIFRYLVSDLDQLYRQLAFEIVARHQN